MIADNTGRKSLWCGLIIIWAAVWLVSGARAQTTDFEQLLLARETTALLEHDGLVIGGLNGGGLVFWDAADPATFERLTSGDDLSGNVVTDLSWTGRHIWVATLGGGLTRITDVAGQRSFRQYASNLSSLDVSAVTGAIVGQSERVYYGTDDHGVGVITDGLSGAVYTREQDGLISNTVTALQMLDGVLFVGTPVGVSRFANNLFTDQNTGLGSLEINDLDLDSDGSLLAATETGVYRWSPTGENWTLVGADNTPARAVSCADGLIYVLGTGVRVFNGSSWQTLNTPGGLLSSIYAGSDFWVGGRQSTGTGSEYLVRHAFVARLLGGGSFEVSAVEASQVLSADGVTFSGGAPYIGAHLWQSVISSRHDGDWQNLRFLPDTPENTGQRLSEGFPLSMATGPDDVVWAGLYAGTGLARFDPATGVTDLINPANSGLLEQSIVNVVVHPDGPVITVHDWSDTEKVEILVDPADWADSANWVVLPRGEGGLGDGPTVWDAVVQRRDVVWFAVEAVGLVRWDINGDQAGPDDPLTWRDQSDDRWDAPLTSVPGSLLDLRGTFGLAVGQDGSIWAGGNGLVQFSYDEQTREATLVTNLREKTSALFEGLVSGNVADITRDANGDIWVATASGVNRVRGTGSEVAVDTYIDLGNYFANPLYALLYSPNVISPLPGNVYHKIATSRDGRQVLVSADQGASLIAVGKRANGGSGQTGSGPFVYPNPYTGDFSDGGLKLGGLVGADLAKVEIYNLDGQLVYADSQVTPETGFWQGVNRVGEPVTTGLYTVRVTTATAQWTLTLAVVR